MYDFFIAGFVFGFVSSVLVRRIAGTSISEMTYFVWSGL